MRYEVLLWHTLGLCFIAFAGHTQSYLPSPHELPDTVPTKYRFDRYKTYIDTKNTLQANNDKNLFNGQQYNEEFSRSFVNSKASFFYSGKIYFNWPKLENYVNAVFKKILEADGIVDDTSYHVYITRIPEFNAFSTYDNKFYVNIGLLANIEDEAQLATVLAHELGHFRHYDTFNSYVEFKKAIKSAKIYSYFGDGGKALNSSVIKNYYANKRNMERAADDFMIKLLPKLGYSFKSAESFFHISQKYEVFDQKYIPVNFNYFYSSHPKSLERSATVLKAGFSKEDGSAFLVDESLFHQLKNESKYELLHLLLAEGKYHDCISHAFEYYLMEASNATYVYYILEALRRWQIINPGTFKLNFITSTPFSKSNDVLLTNINAGYIRLSQFQISNLPETNLFNSQEIEFETNTEAFVYFAAKAIELGCAECYLTLALSELEGIDGYLDKYIQFPNVQYGEFAKAYKNRNLEKFPGRTGVYYSVRPDEIYLNDKDFLDSLSMQKARDFSESLSIYIDSLTKSTEGIVFSNNALNFWNMYYDINMSLRLSSLLNIYLKSNPIYANTEFQYEKSLNYSITKTQSIPWFILDPSHWVYLNKRKVSTIFYVFNALDGITKNNSKLNMKTFYKDGCNLNILWSSAYMTITDNYFKNRFSSCNRVTTNVKWPDKISESIYKRKFLYTLKGGSIFQLKNDDRDAENGMPEEKTNPEKELGYDD